MRRLNANVMLASNSVNQNGLQVDSNQLVSASFQFIFGDATSIGTCKLQASNDIAPARNMAVMDNFTVTNWTDIPNMSSTSTSGASVLLTIPNASYGWLRAVFLNTTPGDTTVTVNMEALSI